MRRHSEKEYKKAFEKSNFKIGDAVKVTLNASHKSELGWCGWVSSMDKYVNDGKIHTITGVSFGSLRLDNVWWFPFYVLEKVE